MSIERSRKQKEDSTNEKIRGIDVRMTSTSPSKQMTSMSKEQNRAMRKKDRNITPFIQLSSRLNNQTSSGNGARNLQRSRMTEREKDVQLDSHQ